MASVTEAELADACRQGLVLDCSDGAARRALDAELIRRCCLGPAGAIDPRGLRVNRALVTGGLDLSAMQVPFPLRFDECEFAGALALEGAGLYELALTGCQLPGLQANGLRVRRDLDLSRSAVSGTLATTASKSKQAAIWLSESDIGGRLLCLDTTIEADGQRAIQADGMHVAGAARMQITARGEVRLIGARIDGSLDLTGAQIESGSGLAMDLAEAAIGGSIFLATNRNGRRPVIRGRMTLASARIGGQFLIGDATIEEPDSQPQGSSYDRSWASGSALNAPRLSVGAEVTLQGECRVTGGIDLAMSEMSSLVVSGTCSLQAPGRTALNAINAELRSSLALAPGVEIAGTIRLAGARIHGNLAMRGARLSAPERDSLLTAQGVVVDGEVELQGIVVNGGRLRFRGATIGNVFDASGARLSCPAGATLSLQQATVRGSVRLMNGFESVGFVVLNRATIEGRLECTGGTFTCPAPQERNQHGRAIEAISATIRGGMDLGWASVSPGVDFTDATTTFLADDPAKWPESFTISGLTYDRFEQPQAARGSGGNWDWRARCEWLSRQAVYDSGPYEQAARVFRQHGYTTEAEEILIEQRRQARRAAGSRRNPPRRIRDAAYGASVGYGYRPGRVLWLLVILLALVLTSLEIPVGQATLRSVTPTGAVYSTSGLLGTTRAAAVGTRARGLAGSAAASGSGTGVGALQPDQCGNGEVRCFNAALYAVDTVLPLLSLDQRSTWYPDPHVRYGTFMDWWLNLATLLGWLLSSIFVLSFARLSRSA